MNEDWKNRNRMLLGDDVQSRLECSHVLVVGVGGVGSFTVEALARAGVGALTIVDFDTIAATNINRQLEALHSTVGRPKVEAMAERIADINPLCKVRPMKEKYNDSTRELIFDTAYDIIVDAIDLVSCKLDLIETAFSRGIPIISALGTGNKTDPTQIRISDISKTETCPLARVVRKELRNRGIVNHRVVWSTEPAKGEGDRPFSEVSEQPSQGRRSVPASVCWVPGCAGLMLAGEAVRLLSL